MLFVDLNRIKVVTDGYDHTHPSIGANALIIQLRITAYSLLTYRTF